MNPRIHLANIGVTRASYPMAYENFLAAKTHEGAMHGFEPSWMPSQLFPFQQSLVEWAVRKGRAAVFADCGLGKTPVQLT